MRTEIVGRIENPEDRAPLEPIVVPVAGYTMDGEEVIEEFAFRPVVPAGAVLRAASAIQPNGVLAVAPIVGFLRKCLLVEYAHEDGEVTNEQERFDEFIDRDDLMIDAELITDVYRTVTAVWSDRPTRWPSGSSSGGSKTKRTPRGARSAASTSKKSRSS